MTEVLIKIPSTKKGKALLDYLKQIDFIEMNRVDRLSQFEKQFLQSVSDLKAGRVRTWKNKTVRLNADGKN